MSEPINSDGEKKVVRWHELALYSGTALVATGAVLLMFMGKGRMKNAGRWAAGVGGGLLTAGFSFPMKALDG